MRLQFLITFIFSLAFTSFSKIYSQCILPSGTYSWGNTELINHITNNCSGNASDLRIPTDAAITIQNNDVWDLSGYGAITFTVQNMGSLGFNGSDLLKFDSGSQLIIENTTNTLALTESGVGTNIRISIGTTTYIGNQFADIIAAGGVSESGFLPVDLIRFYSYFDDEKVILEWETAAEINNKHFEMEHSRNGLDFELLGIVEGNGTTELNHTYKFIHFDPPLGNNYYRLKQVDLDGVYQYFKIISQPVAYEKMVNVKINSMELLSIQANQSAQIAVFDMMGKTVFSDKMEIGTRDFYFEDLAKGHYIVHVFNSDTSELLRMTR